MSREVPLTKGAVALIDDEDWPLVSQFRWAKLGKYAVTSVKVPGSKPKMLSMHRLILNTPKGMWTDHANGDGLDNRRSNIRVCTPSQNAMNRPRVRGEVPLRGVVAANGAYRAQIVADATIYILGIFADAEDAGRAYDAASRLVHGEFGHLNFPDLPVVPLGPITVTCYGPLHPALESLVIPNTIETRRAERALKDAQDRRERAEIAAHNEAILPKLPARTAEIVRAYLTHRSLMDAGRSLGISRERVRQVVAKAVGAGLRVPPDAVRHKPRHSREAKIRMGALAQRIGTRQAAKVLGVAESNLRAWVHEVGVELRGVGRPGLDTERNRAAIIAQWSAEQEAA